MISLFKLTISIDGSQRRNAVLSFLNLQIFIRNLIPSLREVSVFRVILVRVFPFYPRRRT